MYLLCQLSISIFLFVASILKLTMTVTNCLLSTMVVISAAILVVLLAIAYSLMLRN